MCLLEPKQLSSVKIDVPFLCYSYSKQAFLADVSMPYDLPDGTPSFKSYVNSKNNRFLNADMASKNRLQPPCKVLHFYNTPPGLSDDDLRKVFAEHDAPPPAEVRLLQNKSEFYPLPFTSGRSTRSTPNRSVVAGGRVRSSLRPLCAVLRGTATTLNVCFRFRREELFWSFGVCDTAGGRRGTRHLQPHSPLRSQ